MEKMKLEKLNLPQENYLSRMQMKNVTAGDTCSVTHNSSGGTTQYQVTFSSGWSCAEQSSWTNNYASGLVSSGGGSARYDCGCDGWGH